MRIFWFSLLLLGCSSKEHAPFISDNGTKPIAINIGITSKNNSPVDAGSDVSVSEPKSSPVDSGTYTYVPPANSEILEGPCSTTEPHVCYKFLGYLGGNAECFLGKQYCLDGGWGYCTDPTGTFHVHK